ncbi:MAG: hypothetical protein WCP20_19965 [Desulfuromonadales bacterium]
MDKDTHPPTHWLPNWKDPLPYRHTPTWIKPEELTRFYAWQFLRRNTEYQSMFTNMYARAKQVDEHLGNNPRRGYIRHPGIAALTEESRNTELQQAIIEAADRFL